MKRRNFGLPLWVLLTVASHAVADDRSIAIEVDGGITIEGTLTVPEDTEKTPLVLLIAGSGPQNRDASNMIDGHAPHRQWSETLAERGIGSFRYDERGMGTSSGDWSTTTFAQHADDLAAVVAALREQPGVAREELILLGHSEGALLAAAIAERTDPAAIVLLSGPAKPMPDVVDAQARANTHRDGMDDAAYEEAVQKNKAAFLERARAVPSIASLLAIDPRDFYRRVEAPVLVNQGGADQQVEPVNAALLAATLIESGNTDVTLRVHPELNHFLLPPGDGSKRIDESVIRDTTSWILANTRAGTSTESNGPACIGLKFGDTCWGMESGPGDEQK